MLTVTEWLLLTGKSGGDVYAGVEVTRARLFGLAGHSCDHNYHLRLPLSMDVLKAVQAYVNKMITEVPGMKVLLLDAHTVG